MRPDLSHRAQYWEFMESMTFHFKRVSLAIMLKIDDTEERTEAERSIMSLWQKFKQEMKIV